MQTESQYQAKGPRTSRTWVEAFLVVAFSSLPLLLVYGMMLNKSVVSWVAWALRILEVCGGLWIGNRWRHYVQLDNDRFSDPEGTPPEERRYDWVAMASGILVAAGAVMFLLSLSTHAMARAFSE
jgi:hypothetical protein